MINLALNFLEVSVMNLFARKDNVDLTHVQKITKSMADLQTAMEDMIDDGVDVGSGQVPQASGQIQQPTQAAGAAAPMLSYSDNLPVGKVMGLNTESAPVGGGVALASSNLNLVWASKSGKKRSFCK